MVTSLALVIVAVILSLICALFVAIAPGPAVAIFGSIFHGINFTSIVSPVTLAGVVMGVIVLAITAFVAGWLFATAYNYLSEKVG